MKKSKKSLQQASYTYSTDPRQVSQKRPKSSTFSTSASDHYNPSLHLLSTQLKCDDRNEIYHLAIKRAKESFDRYFDDSPHFNLSEKNDDIVINIDKLEKFYDKKKKQLKGHMENLSAIKKELTERAIHSTGHYFSKEKNEYYMDQVDHLYTDYQIEQKKLQAFQKKIEYLKKTAK